jgi:hypothetical protein
MVYVEVMNWKQFSIMFSLRCNILGAEIDQEKTVILTAKLEKKKVCTFLAGREERRVDLHMVFQPLETYCLITEEQRMPHLNGACPK